MTEEELKETRDSFSFGVHHLVLMSQFTSQNITSNETVIDVNNLYPLLPPTIHLRVYTLNLLHNQHILLGKQESSCSKTI